MVTSYEIEHKYLITKEEKDLYVSRLEGLSPLSRGHFEVQDQYFRLRGSDAFVYRYRFDSQLNQLTVKDLGTDTERRLEIDLNLVGPKSQLEAVRGFFETIGILWQGAIHKVVEVFYFADCEIVCYEAIFQDQGVVCLEIEARKDRSLADPLAAIAHFEHNLGLDSKKRCKKSLFQLLVEGGLQNT